MLPYQNVDLDYLYNFLVVTIRENVFADALATSTSDFEISSSIRGKYKVVVKYRLAVSNNMKYWQVFENDKKLENFLLMKVEFTKMRLENGCEWEDDDNVRFINNMKEELDK